MIGAVGASDNTVAVTELLASGVDMVGLEQRDSATGLAVIMVAPDGENIVTVTPGANAPWASNWSNVTSM